MPALQTLDDAEPGRRGTSADTASSRQRTTTESSIMSLERISLAGRCKRKFCTLWRSQVSGRSSDLILLYSPTSKSSYLAFKAIRHLRGLIDAPERTLQT
jgi:hypothetical protein